MKFQSITSEKKLMYRTWMLTFLLFIGGSFVIHSSNCFSWTETGKHLIYGLIGFILAFVCVYIIPYNVFREYALGIFAFGLIGLLLTKTFLGIGIEYDIYRPWLGIWGEKILRPSLSLVLPVIILTASYYDVWKKGEDNRLLTRHSFEWIPFLSLVTISLLDVNSEAYIHILGISVVFLFLKVKISGSIANITVFLWMILVVEAILAWGYHVLGIIDLVESICTEGLYDLRVETILSGGVFGNGYGNSIYKLKQGFMPGEELTVLGEKTGLLGLIVLFGCIISLMVSFFEAANIAKIKEEYFTMCIAIGVGTHFTIILCQGIIESLFLRTITPIPFFHFSYGNIIIWILEIALVQAGLCDQIKRKDNLTSKDENKI